MTLMYTKARELYGKDAEQQNKTNPVVKAVKKPLFKKRNKKANV
ncbi:hypothetical protein ATL39_0329 [Sinobaca qinghaiensis]|uniref:Uncharacterized protein n=1 Tax=Sinobaca qinghaiensis TaxID=342944 RepID=A0A419V7T9_9BACL|nr:hypothetical protein [Sinobaca qinghaiensis]RKD76117.1 hypothetical protein ATL39_0329 [Sinobaca qinghaiensis]